MGETGEGGRVAIRPVGTSINLKPAPLGGWPRRQCPPAGRAVATNDRCSTGSLGTRRRVRRRDGPGRASSGIPLSPMGHWRERLFPLPPFQFAHAFPTLRAANPAALCSTPNPPSRRGRPAFRVPSNHFIRVVCGKFFRSLCGPLSSLSSLHPPRSRVAPGAFLAAASRGAPPPPRQGCPFGTPTTRRAPCASLGYPRPLFPIPHPFFPPCLPPRGRPRDRNEGHKPPCLAGTSDCLRLSLSFLMVGGRHGYRWSCLAETRPLSN